MSERLHKYIARCGVASRRKAEELIARGVIKVNGEKVTQQGILINPETDVVEVDGKRITPYKSLVYYALNKPRGYISTCDDDHAKNKITDLVPPYPRVFPVGRLDKDSEGLIILTNDGELSMKLTHPRFDHEKEYLVHVKIKSPSGLLSNEALMEKLKNLEKGVKIEGKVTRPAKIIVEEVNAAKRQIIFRIILQEGRKRQIRRMCDSLGFTVKSLKRIRIGKLELGNLKPGEYRIVGREEII